MHASGFQDFWIQIPDPVLHYGVRPRYRNGVVFCSVAKKAKGKRHVPISMAKAWFIGATPGPEL